MLISRVFPAKELRLFCGDKARTHTDSKPLARGQGFNANVSVLCASSLSSLLIKSGFFWVLFDRSKAFDLLNLLYLGSDAHPSHPPSPQDYLQSLLKHRFCFWVHRDFAQPEFILAHTAHSPSPIPCPHFVKRCLLTRLDEDANNPGEGLSVQRGTSHFLTPSKHSWATAAQTWILVIDEFI